MSESVESNSTQSDQPRSQEVLYCDTLYRVFVPTQYGPIPTTEDALSGSQVMCFQALFTDLEEEAAQLEAAVALVGPERPWQSKYNPRLLEYILSLPTMLRRHPDNQGDIITYDYLNGKGEPIVTGLLEAEALEIVQKKYAELAPQWQHPAEEIAKFFADKDRLMPFTVTNHGYGRMLVRRQGPQITSMMKEPVWLLRHTVSGPEDRQTVRTKIFRKAPSYTYGKHGCLAVTAGIRTRMVMHALPRLFTVNITQGSKDLCFQGMTQLEVTHLLRHYHPGVGVPVRSLRFSEVVSVLASGVEDNILALCVLWDNGDLRCTVGVYDCGHGA